MEKHLKKLHKEDCLKGLKAALQWLRTFLNSYLFYALEVFLAVFFVYQQKEVQGVLVFVALISLILLICEDVMPTTLPFLLTCMVATNCYDSFDVFIRYVPYGLIVVLCILFHFIVYKKPYSTGESFSGLLFVSIALCAGGLGRYTLMEYARGAYYVFGLGFGMMVAYLLMKSEFSVKRNYDIKERFSVIMLLWAIACMVVMFIGVYHAKLYAGQPSGMHRYLPFSPNNMATFLMFAMPFPLYLSKKNRLWAIFTPLILYGLYCCDSRGGVLFGTIEFFVCAVYWIFLGNKKIRGAIVGGFIFIGVIVFIACWNDVWVKADEFLKFSQYKDESRYIMFLEAIENFRENPLLGTGILDDSILYGKVNVKGTMTWYHMMTAQIIGSMGLVGVMAYVYQFLGRVELIFTKKSAWSLCLGISYLGILLMSQVNPGEFCPIPFELLTVLLFVFQEQRLRENNFKKHLKQ